MIESPLNSIIRYLARREMRSMVRPVISGAEVRNDAPAQRQLADARTDNRASDRGAGENAAQRFNFGKLGHFRNLALVPTSVQ